jgi:hypothetical protein
MVWNLTDYITATRLFALSEVRRAAPGKTRTPVATEYARADMSPKCSVAEVHSYYLKTYCRGCGAGFKFEHAGALRKGSGW